MSDFINSPLLTAPPPPELKMFSAGRFISRGRGRHAERIIDTDEFIYVVSGTLQMFERHKDFELHAGDWLLLRRNRRHGGLADYPGDLSFYWLHWQLSEAIIERLPQQGHAARPEQLTSFLQSYLKELEDYPGNLSAAENPGGESSRILLGKLILQELLRSRPVEKQSVPAFLTAAHRIIQSDYRNEALSSRTLAKELQCNMQYLAASYSRHFHETIPQCINRLRIAQAAKLLLEEESTPVKAILERCAFHDPAYFRRKFFEIYAMTPRDYRKFHQTEYTNSDSKIAEQKRS